MPHIFVIAGHGAGDSGAVGNGFEEAERVRVLAQRIKDMGGDSVTLGDFGRNYYADKGISSLDIPQDWQIVELHMDSAEGNARGGHVIIKDTFEPDAYDMALAGIIADIFPGRSQAIVGRGNLANVNRAAARGYGYRLVENGFISNAGDVDTFNTRLDDIARGYLAAFGINAGEPSQEPAPRPESNPFPLPAGHWYGVPDSDERNHSGYYWEGDRPGIMAIQRALGVAADGFFGPNTREAAVRFQQGAGLVDDGLAGVKTWQSLMN